MPEARFSVAIEQARKSGRVLLDLTESDPSRCDLGWDPAELREIEEQRREGAGVALSEAREAIASYLAGHGASVPLDRILPARTRGEALLALEKLLCQGGDEVLVPTPHRPGLETLPTVELRPYALAFEGRWRLDRRSIDRVLSQRTRAIFVGNPADPTGAELSREELTFLERLCKSREIALIGDESYLDSTLDRSTSVARVSGCLAFHLSGLSGICGLPALEGEWIAVVGPATQSAQAASRLATLLEVEVAGSRPGVRLAPPLLGRRGAYLSRLRSRITRNRSTLAAASLREAPWTLQWGGGIRAVLQVNPVQSEDEICLALLEEGVAVEPAYLAGFPPKGFLLISLLPIPEIFEAALGRLEVQLRGPVLPSALA